MEDDIYEGLDEEEFNESENNNEMMLERIFADSEDVVFCFEDGSFQTLSTKTREIAEKIVKLIKDGIKE